MAQHCERFDAMESMKECQQLTINSGAGQTLLPSLGTFHKSKYNLAATTPTLPPEENDRCPKL